MDGPAKPCATSWSVQLITTSFSAGDQLYRMDYRHVLRQHLETNSDITVGTIPVNRAAASGFGIMHTDEKRRIIEFVEKPKDPQVSWMALRILPTFSDRLANPMMPTSIRPPWAFMCSNVKSSRSA